MSILNLFKSEEEKKVIQLFDQNPQFIKDILHLHFYRTEFYYEDYMNDFPRLQISGELKIALFIQYAKSVKLIDGKFNFEFHVNPQLGWIMQVPFVLLFNELVKSAFTSNNIEDMFSNFYKSDSAVIIKIAETFKDEPIELSSELFSFIKREECDPYRRWELKDFLGNNWNFTLLSLNKNVWDTAFSNIINSKIAKRFI